MVEITKLESFLINAIAHDEYNTLNGAQLTEDTQPSELCTWCFVDSWATKDVSMKQIKGILAALVKKGLISIQVYDDDDSTVNVTEEFVAIALEIQNSKA